MRIDIISAIPKLLTSYYEQSILKRAQEKKLVEIYLHDLRDFSNNKQKSIDDYAFGGGAGMVLSIEPLYNCIKNLKKERDYDEIIFMCPDGEQLTQPMANQHSLLENLIIICGHYKGIDQRIRDHIVTKEISIRLLPGVLNDETSALSDSFQDNLIAPPVYTRPSNFNGWEVPKVLTSGNLKEIEKWRFEKSLENTKKRRPDLLK